MSRWRLVGLGLIAYLLALLVTAPATLIDAQLDRASNGGLRLALARGTLWSGTGQLELLDANRRSGLAKEIAWRLRPAHLLRGSLRFDITLDSAPRAFSMTLTPSRLEVTEADINLPAAALGLGVPKLSALGLTGNLLLHLARLSIGSASIQGSATLQWQGAGSTYAPIAPLGDYELRIEGKGK